MNEEFDNEMRGVLFKNDRKTKPNQPDYKGHGELKGVEYWISGWIKSPRSGGSKFMSLAFTEKEENEFEKQAPKEFNDDDDIPF